MLGQHECTIRRLQAPDVHAVLEVIVECRREYGLERRVEAVLDPSDRDLFEIYRSRRSAYFVAVAGGQIVGGAGIARLAGTEASVCELQRMYLRQASRRLGIGHGLLQECLQAARQFRYQSCYAETISEMTAAIAFYERQGFRRLEAPIGKTGHGHNDCWLMLELDGGYEQWP